MGFVNYSFTALKDTDPTGINVIGSQSVEVFNAHDGVTYATIYSDEGVTPIAQPGAATDPTSGVLEFWILPGFYIISSGTRTENVLIDDGTRLKVAEMSVITNRIIHYKIGEFVDFTERTSGNGGGGRVEIVDATIVTQNGYDIVTGDATKSLQLIVTAPLNVRTFGATGSPTGDDTLALQAVIDYLSPDGGSIFVPKGIYNYTSLTILDGNISIIGEGRMIINDFDIVTYSDTATGYPATVLRCTSASGDGITIGKSSVTIDHAGAAQLRDISFIGKTTGNLVYLAYSSQGSSMDNVFIGVNNQIAGTALKLEGIWMDRFSNMDVYARQHDGATGSYGLYIEQAVGGLSGGGNFEFNSVTVNGFDRCWVIGNPSTNVGGGNNTTLTNCQTRYGKTAGITIAGAGSVTIANHWEEFTTGIALDIADANGVRVIGGLWDFNSSTVATVRIGTAAGTSAVDGVSFEGCSFRTVNVPMLRYKDSTRISFTNCEWQILAQPAISTQVGGCLDLIKLRRTKWDATGLAFTVSDLIQSFAEAGTHTGAANASVLTDSAASWEVGELVGRVISNTTDGSTTTITANTANTITGTLAGGTDNDWDVSDAYTIVARDSRFMCDMDEDAYQVLTTDIDLSNIPLPRTIGFDTASASVNVTVPQVNMVGNKCRIFKLDTANTVTINKSASPTPANIKFINNADVAATTYVLAATSSRFTEIEYTYEAGVWGYWRQTI